MSADEALDDRVDGLATIGREEREPAVKVLREPDGRRSWRHDFMVAPGRPARKGNPGLFLERTCEGTRAYADRTSRREARVSL